jgi:hypothetical protein
MFELYFESNSAELLTKMLFLLLVALFHRFFGAFAHFLSLKYYMYFICCFLLFKILLLLFVISDIFLIEFINRIFKPSAGIFKHFYTFRVQKSHRKSTKVTNSVLTKEAIQKSLK